MIDMIRYPTLHAGGTIGVTAPSSGAEPKLHHLLHEAKEQMELQGFHVQFGDTVWIQHKAKSAPAKVRAAELTEMMNDEQIDMIIPVWGGEILIELLPYIQFEKIDAKWILGYSDTSILLLATTLTTGLATAHGPNFADLRAKHLDETTAMWKNVLATKTGQFIMQHSSATYQKDWPDISSEAVFQLTEPTYWKSVTNEPVKMEGRLLGGCIDIIRH